MNTIKEIERINLRELELGVEVGKGSWHDQYAESAYVFVGGLDYEMTEGDVITVMSQFGEVVDVNMPRDKETHKPKGFAFVMYEDQRSTVLAVDNMNGAQVLGRTIRVDHCRKYTQPGTKDADGNYQEPEEPSYNAMPPELSGSDDSDSAPESADSVDEDDPMAAYLRSQRKSGGSGSGSKKSKSKSVQKKIKEDPEAKRRARENETPEERKARRDAKKARIAEKERRAGKDVRGQGKGKERERERERDTGRSDRDRYGGGDGKGTERDIKRERSPFTGGRENSRRQYDDEDDDRAPGGSRIRNMREESRGAMNGDSPRNDRHRASNGKRDKRPVSRDREYNRDDRRQAIDRQDRSPRNDRDRDHGKANSRYDAEPRRREEDPSYRRRDNGDGRDGDRYDRRREDDRRDRDRSAYADRR